MQAFDYYLDIDTTGTITTYIPRDGVVILEGFESLAEYHTTSVQSFALDGLAGQKSIFCGHEIDDSLTVAQLKSICTQLGLSTSGLKADLLARVQEATS